MGTEVDYKNSFPGYCYSMRNVNEDSSSSGWPMFYGDNGLTNGHYYNGYEKDELKQKMLQHEAIFKNQVFELHRLYRRQRDMMEEAKRKDFPKYQIPIDTSSPSSLFPAQKPADDHPHKWQIPSARPSIFGAEISNSPQKDSQVVECRPLKVRKKLFDLQLPADEYDDLEELEQIQDNNRAFEASVSSYPSQENRFVPTNGVKMFGQRFTGSNGLADLNEPVYVQELMGDDPRSVNFLGSSAKSATFNHLPVEGKGNGREMFSCYMREPGNTRSNMSFTSRCFEPNKLHTPLDTIQHLHEISARNQAHSHFSQNPLLFTANRISSPYPSANTPDIGNSWSPSGASWGKPNDGLTRKLTSFQTHPSFLSSSQNHELFGNKWHRMNAGSGSDIPARNGFYHGSSSGSKDYRNCNKIDLGPRKILKGSNFIDLTEPDTTKGVDLNNFIHDLSNEEDDLRKRDKTGLPWVSKPGVICKNEPGKDDSLAKNGKLLGFPIFGNSCVSRNDAETESRRIDINVAWDDAMDSDPIEKWIDAESCDNEIKSFKNHFDLNSCVTEDEDLVVTESVKSSKNAIMEIDLEAPAVSEEAIAIDPEPDRPENEKLVKDAAEAIVAISGQPQDHDDDGGDGDGDADADPLLWFVDVITKNEGLTLTHEMDEYEVLTLRLELTKEEDYMPGGPVVPDCLEPDEVGPGLPNRPRRGQARRGRPRRDFQRDILPGLVSLSRHEITEDLQVFGGLMKATGHTWNLSTRKRFAGRGRRKVKVPPEAPPAAAVPPLLPPPPPELCKQVNNVEMVGLEVAGWGKTTRRPRRQRCAAGNSVTVQLT